MPVFQSLTPNLVVSDIERSLSFYRFLNAQHAAPAEYPELAATVAGGSWTMFVTMDAVDDLHASLSGKARIVMPLETKFYGMREFAIADPDGFVITFAENVAG